MLAPPREPAQRARPSRAAAWRRARPPLSRRIRRVALLTAILCLVPALVSYAGAVVSPSNSSFGIRTVEWMKDNGLRGFVNYIENVYYSLNAPAKGGKPLHALPKLAGALDAAGALRRRGIPSYRPPAIRPLVSPALPGEGVWRATFAPGGSSPPVLITSFRPDPANYPDLVAGVAWIDHTRTSVWLYPGRLEPGVTLPSRGPMEVPPHKRSQLVASFNSGFKLTDSGGGFGLDGRTYAPMKGGVATIVRYRDGHVDVIGWTGGSSVGPDVIYARQNLPLIVNNGHPNPNLSDGPEWGATLGNAIQVWRSSVGVDRYGNLIYAAANFQTVRSLAEIMIRAGAVRAMELDINVYWTSFITYRFPGAGDPANLLPTMNRPPTRYLSPEDRDFFGVYVQ
jgi:hypothetical protein